VIDDAIRSDLGGAETANGNAFLLDHSLFTALQTADCNSRPSLLLSSLSITLHAHLCASFADYPLNLSSKWSATSTTNEALQPTPDHKSHRPHRRPTRLLNFFPGRPRASCRPSPKGTSRDRAVCFCSPASRRNVSERARPCQRNSRVPGRPGRGGRMVGQSRTIAITSHC
jgi:hypothetical protein